MTRSIAVFTCVLGLTACDHDDARPARAPSAMADTPGSGVQSGAPSPNATPLTTETAGRPATATNDALPLHNGPPPSGAPPVAGSSNSATSSAASLAAGAQTSAPVVSNPGTADGTKNADNTKVNDRDRHGALTAMDQGNSAPELKITADLRKSVMSDKSLSFTAKNLKIITVGTKVTLRGPVNNDSERSAIEARAKQIQGVTEVDNQIEVKK
jgi:hyperosmotically inducible protein